MFETFFLLFTCILYTCLILLNCTKLLIFYKNGQKKVSEAQSWQIIGLMKEKTKSQQEIADLVGVSRKCVFPTKCNYEKTSRAKELSRLGRPPKLTSRDESYISRKVRINPKKALES
ncbi:unnamed protein product [Brachionus calyciflorus]|uniref:Uncharacterized protein n=1 Tax=Brachionus calyciflorus TaxID=104777 RepID=A0A813M4V1_9BILA|nr:unnamed protein product [Brachionus calyciflorus]